jgi:hypothetical protein
MNCNNYIVRYRGNPPSNGTPGSMKKLVFKSRPDAVSTAKRKIMLGVDDVSLSTGYPGVWDDASAIKRYADQPWFLNQPPQPSPAK